MPVLSTSIKRGVAVASAAALLLSLAACSGSSGGGGGGTADTKTVTIAYNSDLAPTGYDPVRYSRAQALLFDGLYDSLAATNPDGTWAPGLATEFVYNEDSTVLTMTLQDDVTFADGSKLSAELVKGNLDRRSDPELSAYSAFTTGGAAEMKSVDVVDDTHVAITFVAPQKGFETSLTSVAGMIVGQDAIDDSTTLETTPDGSGPFALDKSTVKGTSYVLTKNADHPRASDFAFDKYVIKPITDPNARTNAAISGQVDTAFITTATASLAEDKGLGISQNGGTVVSMLVFDKSGATVKAFADPNVRVALGMAINREALVDGLHPGDLPTANALPSDNPGYSDDIETEYGYNVDKAKKLLADAGYASGIQFSIIASSDNQTDLEAIQKDFKAVGVTMDIRLSTSTAETFAAVNTDPLGYIPLNWGNPVGTMFGVVLGFANPHQEQNPALQGATGALAGAQTDADRAAALTSLNKELVASAWLIPVYEQLTSWAYNTKKVAPVTFPGQGDTPLLSSFQPAA